MDICTLSDKQINEFKSKYKNRFTPTKPPKGIHGKQGFSIKINRQDVNSSLQIFIPNSFPTQPPIFYVKPSFNNALIDANGRIIDNCLIKWNLYSNLKNCVSEVLLKLESKVPIQSQSKFQIPQPQIEDNKKLLNDITNELNNKSIEELIYINFNTEHFIKKFLKEEKETKEQLLKEVKDLCEVYEEKKKEYDRVKEEIEQCKNYYVKKESEFKILYQEMDKGDGMVNVDKLVSEMKIYIEEQVQKPRHKVIQEFMAKKINFETFKEKFKEITMKYHYYSIIKDKLYLCK